MHSSTESAPAAPTAPAAQAPLGKQARLIIGVLVVCALAALLWPKGSGTFKEPGGFLFDSEGRATTLGPKLEPVSLVHFWATWCPPCRDEIPSLQRLAKDFSTYDDFGLVMVAVADETQKAKVFLGDWGTMALYDPNWDVAKRYGTDKLPETYLVVRGQVVKKFVGQTDWDDPQLRELIASRLKEAGSAPGASGS